MAYEQKADKIVNLGHADTIVVQGPLIVNTNGQTPISALCIDHAENDGSDALKKQVEEKPCQDQDDIWVRPPRNVPYQRAVHQDGDLLNGLVFKLTIPEQPLTEDDDLFTHGINYFHYEEILLSRTESYKIHTAFFEHKTLTGAINEEDMVWDWKWDRPETVRNLLARYLDDVFSYCTKESKALKFRIYCSFAVGEYTIRSNTIQGNVFDNVSTIHEGMSRLFTPLSTDYEEPHDYETQEFKESRSRHYLTPNSKKDYLDEGIIIGTTDLKFIGGMAYWYKPVVCNQFDNSTAVILYQKERMPGLPQTRLERIKHAIKSL